MLAVATGPVGLGLAVAGGLAGGKLGGMLGKRFDGDETLLVDVGDNRDEVAVQTREALLAHAEKIMHEVIGQIDHLCFAQIDAWLDAIAVRLNALRAELGAQCPALEDKRS